MLVIGYMIKAYLCYDFKTVLVAKQQFKLNYLFIMHILEITFKLYSDVPPIQQCSQLLSAQKTSNVDLTGVSNYKSVTIHFYMDYLIIYTLV